MKVKDPTGQTWRVTRRWVPWRRRLRGSLGRAFDIIPDGLGDDPISAVIGAIFLLIALPFLVVALVGGLELLLVFLVVPFAALVRAVSGHWTIEARRGFTIWWDGPAGGWRESGAQIAVVAAAITRGELPPPTAGRHDRSGPHLSSRPTAATPTTGPFGPGPDGTAS